MHKTYSLLGACCCAALFIGCADNNRLSSSTSAAAPAMPVLAAPDARLPQPPSTFTIRNAAESVIYSFSGGSDGQDPESALLDVNGTLYGTTLGGGTKGDGTVYTFTGTTEKVLHTFSGADGAKPLAGLTKIGTLLYGTTTLGGTSGVGTVFSISPAGAQSVIYSFSGPDGADPSTNVIDGKLLARRTIYGTTSGDAYNNGSAFEMSDSRGQYGRVHVLHTFMGAPDGFDPASSFAILNGLLYGTTYNGGILNNCQPFGEAPCGTVFSLTASGTEQVLWDFGAGSAGQYGGIGPDGQLAVLNGVLYGTTSEGGDLTNPYGTGAGTVFSFTPGASQPEKRIRVFEPALGDGAYPYSGLILVQGNFYGTTRSGGAYQNGTVFEVTPSGTETVLHSFGAPSSADGINPVAGLLYLRGTFYGTTSAGGAHGKGTLFAVRPLAA